MQSFILFENTYVLGIIGVFLFTVFLIIILQYKTIVGIFKTKKSKEPSQKCSKLSKTDHDKPSHIADYYTPDQIEEIRRCAIKLHKYSPHEEIGAGEPAGLNEREQVVFIRFYNLILLTNLLEINIFRMLYSFVS